ncbi:MAG: tetratricopeptide repeat protein, partial [Bdellovibrionales bacterium]|nr:tetratricopeptide repeat protein [Bdellovibrionales bacterium]
MSRMLSLFLFQFSLGQPSSNALLGVIVIIALVLLLALMVGNRSKKASKPRSPSRAKIAPGPKIPLKEDLLDIAEHQLNKGAFDQAMISFEQGGYFARAAEVAVLTKNIEKAALYFEKAGELTKAANIYFDLKKYPKAEQVLETLGQSDELGEIYKKRGEHILAAKAFLKASKYESAAKILEDLGNFIEAADAFNLAYENAKQDIVSFGMDPYRPDTRRLGNKAAELFKKTGQQKRAAKLYLELQMHRDAALCAIELKDYQKAAEIFEMMGDIDEAEKYWKMSGNPSKAAKIVGERLIHDGQSAKAIEKFVEVGEHARAAEIYLEMHQPNKAAELYEKAGDFSIAASFYKQAGDLEKAASCFEQAGELRSAIECYEQASLFDREISLRKQMGDFVGVAKKLYERGIDKEALSFLNKVRDTDARFKTAQSLKGQIYLSMGDTSQAEEYLKKSIQNAKEIDHDDLDTLYTLAKIPKKPNAKKDALQMLDNLLSKNMVE